MLNGRTISKREEEVLLLIADGYSSKEVADRLCLAKSTVDFHLANVYDKLKVRNRVQAIRIASRLGLLGHDVPKDEGLEATGEYESSDRAPSRLQAGTGSPSLRMR